jgi:hypothetical protein
VLPRRYGRQAKAVAEAAEADPETFGPIAEEMDRSGKIDPAYKKVQLAEALAAGGPGRG